MSNTSKAYHIFAPSHRVPRVLILLTLLLCAIFVLLSCGGRTTELEMPDGGRCRVVTSAGGSVIRLDIVTSDGAEFEIRPKSSLRDGGIGVEFVDINFDGRIDIRLPSRETSDGVYYSNFIREGDGYYPITSLDAIVSPEIDAQNRQLRSQYSKYTVEPATDDFPEVYISEYGVDIYTWPNGFLTLSARESYTYYSESDIYCVAQFEQGRDGELEAVSERWLSPEQYNAIANAPKLKK